MEPVSECQHSRKGWKGENHLLNTDSALGCRHHGHLDNLQASPEGCTGAEPLIPTDRCLHSVLWNATEDTSSGTGSLGTGERPLCYSSCGFPSRQPRASQTSDPTATEDDASAKRAPSRHLP